MKAIVFALLVACYHLSSVYAQSVTTPDKIYGQLFTDVQMSHVFPDNKTFADCIPKRAPEAIIRDYKTAKGNASPASFNLKAFVEENFMIPVASQNGYQDTTKDVVKHINNLWEVLKRQNDSAIKGSSLLPLPYPYIVPGGRFREIYYWDSYFTMLGLKESGQYELMESMIKNFAHLIHTYGHIPNGNRTYYLSRSQPPFFSLMVNLLAEVKGEAVWKEYLPAMQMEYDYWMDKTGTTKYVVRMPDGSILNRYYDQLNIPRQESYAPDVATAQKAAGSNKEIFRELRTAAESGWDFSTRWFADGKNLTTIQTTKYIPVDMNCLLYALERNLSKAYDLNGDNSNAERMNNLAEARKKAINKYCWSIKWGWYVDYNMETKRHSPELTLAGLSPFFLKVADAHNIFIAAENIRTKFLQAGGVTTTLKHSGEQWDAPNGWAPLEWITISGLDQYNQQDLAKTIAQRWVQLNVSVFKQTGKLMEKYNVYELNIEGGGGEYPSQDGFGWTNGVLLALIKKYGIKY